MRRWFSVVVVSGVMAGFVVATAHAGLPRGAVLSANEQDADPATGVTLARGNAEISIETHGILGRADQIELHPAANEIQFKGRALVTVGEERFEGEAVTCALDFSRCSAVLPKQAPTREQAQTGGQALPPPSGVGAAATSP